MRIVWLDTDTERNVPHVVTDHEPVESFVLTGKRKDSEYGYCASHVIRRATPAEVDAWRTSP